MWEELGLVPESEIHGGYQSRVFLAGGQSTRIVVKLLKTVDGESTTINRAEFTRRLAAINESVVGPTDIVATTNGWTAVCYPYVEGVRPDVDSRHDVEAMAATLAGLHDSMSACEPRGLPLVPGLITAAHDNPLAQGHVIHGDYATANLIKTTDGLRVIDFDDCGQGSVEFELGNTLYMERFDAWNSGRPERYEQFRTWFVDAYRSASGSAGDDELIDAAIGVRTAALQRWLDHPADAPPGVRYSPPEWKHHLRTFLESVL